MPRFAGLFPLCPSLFILVDVWCSVLLWADEMGDNIGYHLLHHIVISLILYSFTESPQYIRAHWAFDRSRLARAYARGFYPRFILPYRSVERFCF